MSAINSTGTALFRFPILSVDLELLVEIHKNADIDGNQYGLGRKISLSVSPEDAVGRSVDCSGWVRYLLYHASGKLFVLTDGSVQQHDQIRELGFKKSTPQSAKRHDGALRIAFLPRSASASKIGHVALILDGQTLESHGGTGPDSRAWTGNGWQALTEVYVLTPPEVEA